MTQRIDYTYIMVSSSRNLYVGVTTIWSNVSSSIRKAHSVALLLDTAVIASSGLSVIAGSVKPLLARKN